MDESMHPHSLEWWKVDQLGFHPSFLKACISGCMSLNAWGKKHYIQKYSHSLRVYKLPLVLLLVTLLFSILNDLFYECIGFVWYTLYKDRRCWNAYLVSLTTNHAIVTLLSILYAMLTVPSITRFATPLAPSAIDTTDTVVLLLAIFLAHAAWITCSGLSDGGGCNSLHSCGVLCPRRTSWNVVSRPSVITY